VLPGFFGELTVMVPVAISHVGCTISNEGAAGPSGFELITTFVFAPIHPFVFLIEMA
jgi:hypothetical protein